MRKCRVAHEDRLKRNSRGRYIVNIRNTWQIRAGYILNYFNRYVHI